MASALKRYQLYVSHVGEDTRNFFASLDAQPEEDVRAMLEQKGFGHRMYLARIWMDFRKKMRQESDDEAYLSRINRSIEAGEAVAVRAEAGLAISRTSPVHNLLVAFISRLKGR